MIAIPIVITLVSFAVAVMCIPKMEDNHNAALAGIAMMVEGFIGLLFIAIATVVSLLSWVVYLGMN